MATSIIDTKTKRGKLEHSSTPYWDKISKGRYIGYRKGTGDGGSWIARLGRKQSVVDGSFEGKAAYDDALKEVVNWCDREAEGGNSVYTLDECLKDYVENLRAVRNASAAKAARQTLSRHVDEDMRKKEVRKITTTELKKWHQGRVDYTRDDEGQRKSKDSANRILVYMKAALNLAFNNREVESNAAWAGKRVERFKGVQQARTLFLTDLQVKALLSVTEGKYHDLLLSAIHTGARYGELINAVVSDLDIERRVLAVDGKTGKRDIFLSDDAFAFFTRMARSKTPKAELLTSPTGGAWKKGQQANPTAAAKVAAKLPGDMVFYSLRHYYISKAVNSGTPLVMLAKNCGTSVDMIEKTYFKFQPDDARNFLNRVELAL